MTFGPAAGSAGAQFNVSNQMFHIRFGTMLHCNNIDTKLCFVELCRLFCKQKLYRRSYLRSYLMTVSMREGNTAVSFCWVHQSKMLELN